MWLSLLLWQDDIKKILLLTFAFTIYNLQNGAIVKLMFITNQMKIVTMKQGLNMMMTHQMEIMIMKQCLGKKNNSLVTLWKVLGFVHNGINPFPRQPPHTLKEAIKAQVISLRLDRDFGKFSIYIQNKILVRIF